MLSYSIILLRVMINRTDSVVTSSTVINFLGNDPTKHNITQKEFGFGFYPSGEASIKFLFDKRYFKTSLYQYSLQRDSVLGEVVKETVTELSLTSCKEQFSTYLGEDLTVKLGLVGAKCSNVTNFVIGGNFMSSDYNLVALQVSKCVDKPYCKSEAEINAVLNYMKVGIAVSDYYFDVQDYDNPVKINVVNDYEFSLIGGFTKSVQMKIRVNEVTDAKNPFPMTSAESYKFYSVGDVSVDAAADVNESPFEALFVLDSKYNKIERKVYTLGDMLGQIGGMHDILLLMGTLAVGVFTTKIYTASLLSNLYQVEKYNVNLNKVDTNQREESKV